MQLIMFSGHGSANSMPMRPFSLSPPVKYFSGVVTVKDSQSGKSFSSTLNLAKKCSEITNKMF